MERAIVGSGAPPVRPLLLADDGSGRFVRVYPWTVACLFTLATHAGLYWYLTRAPIAEITPPVTEPAAVMIDMASEVQQAFNQIDQAVAKPMAEADIQPPPPDEPKPDPVPPVEESPADAIAPLPPKPPERKVETPPEKKPPPKPRKPPGKPTKAATHAASGPRSDRHEERTTSASTGAASAEVVADWKSQVSAAINRNKRSAGEKGSVALRIAIAASGAITSVSVVSSSGSADLDSAAEETARRSSPLPSPPTGATTVTFRINFH